MAAPLGNRNAARGAIWREALIRAIDCWPDAYESQNNNEFMKGINAAAHSFVKKMMTDGDYNFFKEFGDRIEGKAKQRIELDANITSHEATLEQLE